MGPAILDKDSGREIHLSTMWNKDKAQGQSLVELAMVLPVFVLLIGGIVEMSNLLVSHNRITTATRMAAGFGAANFDPADWNGTSDAMGQVVFNTVTETMDLAPELWDVWSIHVLTNSAGDDFELAEFKHFGGNGSTYQVIAESDWNTAIWPQLKAELLGELQASPADAGDVELVATVAFHKLRTILGLPVWQWAGFKTLRSASVMRVNRPAAIASCAALPIGASLGNRSLWPSDQPFVPPGDERYPFDAGASYYGGSYYWKGWNMEGTTDPPFYTLADSTAFPRHVSGVSLNEARPGYLYLANRPATGPTDDLTWLRWDANGSATDSAALESSLLWPGNSFTYLFVPWSDDGLGLYDQLAVSFASLTSVARDEMRHYVDTAGRALPMVVYTPEHLRGGDFNGDGWGTSSAGTDGDSFEIYGLAMVRLIGWYLPVGEDWLLVEFVRWANDCGSATQVS